MRKIVLACVAILFATTFSYAQDVKKFSWGIKGALNLASEYGGDTYETKLLTGFSAGFVAELGLSRLVSFQPELLYSMEGNRHYKNDVEQQGIINNIYGYLKLPLMFKFYVYRDRLSVDVGPYVSYMLTATEKNTPRNMATEKIDMLDKDLLANQYRIKNKYDIGGGIGVSYRFGKNNAFDASGRYSMGFVKTLEDITNRAGNPIKVDNKNCLIQIGLGARF